MKKLLIITFVLTALIAALLSCGPAKNNLKFDLHPVLQTSTMPEVIPIETFFASKESSHGYKISPDGKIIAWIAIKDRRATIHFKYVGQTKVRHINTAYFEYINGFKWALDSRYLMANGGWSTVSWDIKNPGLPPHLIYDLRYEYNFEHLRSVRTFIVQTVRSEPQNVILQTNARDLSIFDYYKLNIKTGKKILIKKGTHHIARWIFDREGNIKARVTKSGEKRNLEILDEDEVWQAVTDWGTRDDSTRILGFSQDKRKLWVLTNIDRDKISLFKVDMETGEKTVVVEDPDFDLYSMGFSDIFYEPVTVGSSAEHQKIFHLNDRFKKLLDFSSKHERYTARILSADSDEWLFTVRLETDKSTDYYLVNRETGSKELLGQSPINQHSAALSDVRPISFKSRDGLTLHGYLTLPKGTTGRNLPMVLYVHGGPWARDKWHYDRTVQFLANRGYVVLQINYRGSSGYGREFMEKAIGEFAQKMHDDLIDGVDWAVREGIVDKNKIAIFGASYGGYAALVGATFTPDTFAGAIDLFGPSSLESLVEDFPSYWSKQYWYKYVGSGRTPKGRKKMESRSPLFKTSQVKIPILIAQGGEDTRVTWTESDRMVKALRDSGKRVKYLYYPDAGHGLVRSRYILNFYSEVEIFLAEILGGRMGKVRHSYTQY